MFPDLKEDETIVQIGVHILDLGFDSQGVHPVPVSFNKEMK